MKFFHKGMLALFFSVNFFVSASSLAAARPGVEGHYTGVLDLTYDRPRKVSIEVTLTLTGETTTLQLGPNHMEERQIIDGNFLVDGEGGPYIFTKVSYNLDKNLIDLRYNRRVYTNASSPADFRLVGKFDQLGNISGPVQSGNRGPIGTFQLSQDSESGLEVKRKYLGAWRGSARMTNGTYHSFDIEIGEGLTQTSNPFDLEFDYTPGKMAHYSFDRNKFNFNHIVIDYLRQRMFLSRIDAAGRNTLTAECDVDFATGSLQGTLFGMYKGKSADLFLEKVY
jgi:hypothetical protein